MYANKLPIQVYITKEILKIVLYDVFTKLPIHVYITKEIF